MCDSEDQHGLRTRRRRETQRDIAGAALELFERQGVAATTVEEIAAAAGIAPRTFYRHAVTKVNALFVDDDWMERLVAAVRAVDQTVPAVIHAIEQASLANLDALDARPPAAHARILRARRLILADHALLARALTREDDQVQRLTAMVLRADDAHCVDEFDARTVVTAISTTVRLAHDEWARRAERGETVPIRSLYLRARTVLTGHFAEGRGVPD